MTDSPYPPCPHPRRQDNTSADGGGAHQPAPYPHRRILMPATPAPYPPETLDPDEDDGTMPDNVAALAEQVVGHRIVKVEDDVEIPRPRYSYWGRSSGLAITLDNGKRVFLADTDDCCASTELHAFLLHADKVDHIITGVGTTNGYTTWHVYADMGDVLELTVGWSSGNPFSHGYGFDIVVTDYDPAAVTA